MLAISVWDMLFGGPTTFMVGLEEMEDGALKVYVDCRSRGLYVIVKDEEVKKELRSAWGDTSVHVLIPLPRPDQIFCDDDELALRFTL